MPILPPSLDDRRFDDLVEEMLARIPAHTPEWTNPRLGDPGRTLIELFAWLGDALLYRANLVPERQRLVFLKLLGQQLKPALPATGIVGLAYAQNTELTVNSLAPGARIAGPVPFETLTETTVLPVSAEVYYKRALTDAEAADMADVIEGLKSVHKLTDAKGYETTPVFDGGRAEPNGIDVFALSADRALWIALLAPKAAQPLQQPSVNGQVLQALGGGDTGAPALLSLGVVPALTLPEQFDDFIDAANPRVPDSGDVGNHHPRCRRRRRLSHADTPGRDRHHRSADPAGRTAAGAPGRIAAVGTDQRCRRESHRGCGRFSAAPGRYGKGFEAARMAASAPATGQAGREPAAILGRHQCRADRPAHHARRARPRRFDWRGRSDLPVAAIILRCRQLCASKSKTQAWATECGREWTISRPSAAIHRSRAARRPSS